MLRHTAKYSSYSYSQMIQAWILLLIIAILNGTSLDIVADYCHLKYILCTVCYTNNLQFLNKDTKHQSYEFQRLILTYYYTHRVRG